MPAKILMIDTETAPKRAYVWGMWKNNIGLNQLISDGYVLCWNAKWLGEDEVLGDSLDEYPEAYNEDPENDYYIMESLWKLLDEADIVVAHNAKHFDIPVVNARFVLHGMHPPSPYKIVDTLQLAKKYFRFTSNRLDALGQLLGLGRKVDTGGFSLWARVLDKDAAAWDKMTDYCEQDVRLLEEVYLKLRAWDKQHPNVGLYTDMARPVCNVCGSEHVVKKGYDYTNVSIFHRYKCVSCGHNMRERYNITDKAKRKNILSSSK
jgi:DNA polymerase III epsilon subunit-like protein